MLRRLFSSSKEESPIIKLINEAAKKRVKKLDLSNKEIKVLPREIGKLSNLVKLDLSNNNLSELPPEIGQLSNLKELDLSNYFTIAPSPLMTQESTQNFTGLITSARPKLARYWKGLNHLPELPTEIGKLTKLKKLYINDNKLSKLPHEIGKLSNLTELDLNNNLISKLPPEFGQLSNLKELSLTNNLLKKLPSTICQLNNLELLELRYNKLSKISRKIGQLSNLKELDLSSNKLGKLPTEFGQLTSLKEIDLDNNKFGVFPAEICQLSSLTKFTICNNQLTSLPTEIEQLVNLRKFELSGNPLTTLPHQIVKLPNLTRLDLEDTQLSELSREIGRLSKLTHLYLQANQLSELPTEIGKLSNLTHLDIDENRLSTLPPEIGELSRLTHLELRMNKLSALPPEIGQLSNLNELDLYGNQLSELPPEIGQLSNLEVLYLQENPLSIPPEILEKTTEPSKIISYFIEQLKAVAPKPLNEAKMLLVGQGGVGKTSLVKRIIEDDYDPHETKTEGINIRKWEANINGTEIQINIWDFGGQEIMHATHQFFLTKRSLYLLILNAREDEHKNRIEYWLKLIQSFGGDSPIIVVVNKCDDELMPDLDRRGLMIKYPSIKGFVDTSAKTRQGLNELIGIISQAVGQLEHIHDKLPASWFAVKKKLERKKSDYISYTKFEKLCHSQGVHDELSQQTLIGFLHDLGVVLNFREDMRLQETNILNPHWVTNGVYQILNYNPLFQKNGVLDQKMLANILQGPDYPPNKHKFIIDMMRKFELCFDFEGYKDKRFLVPDLLPKEEPYSGEWDPKKCLGFQYHYTVLPGSVMSRFIVRSHRMIHQNTYWRNGVVLACGRNKALVKADREEMKIFIWIDGPVKTRRECLAVIRDQFVYIHKTISKLAPEEKVPIPDYPNIVVDYEHLLTLEEIGKGSFVPEGLREEVNVTQLLNGVVSEEERFERWAEKTTGVKIQRVDKLVIPQSERSTVIMEQRVRKEKVIEIGANATVSAPVVVADSIQNSFNALAESEVEDDVKKMLEELLKAVNQVNKEVPEEQEEAAEEMARDAETLVKEAASSNPRRKWYEVSIEGLEQAAINIGRVAEPVLGIVGQLRKALLGI